MKLTPEAVAELTGGELSGPGRTDEITGAAPFERAGPGDLAFLADPAQAGRAAGSKALCLLASPSAAGLENFKGALILVKNPKFAFGQALAILGKALRPPKPCGRHPSSVVSPSAIVAENVHIGPLAVVEAGAVIGYGACLEAQCFVGEKAKIGAGARLCPGAKVLDSCEIGDRSILHAGAVIGSDGYGYASDGVRHQKIPQLGRVVVGADVEIGANAAIDRAALEVTMIGDGTKIDNLVQIAHNVRVGKNCLILAQAGIAGSSAIGDGAIIAGQAGISDHVTIGERTIVMGMTGVISDLGPDQVVFGHMARPRLQALKIEALLSKLPGLNADVRKIKKRLGLNDAEKNDK